MGNVGTTWLVLGALRLSSHFSPACPRSLILSCLAKGANKRVEEVPPQRRREEER